MTTATTSSTTPAGASASRVRRQRQSAFRAVFPIDVPQPSPLLPHLSPGEAFGGPHASPRINSHRSSTTITRSITASASASSSFAYTQHAAAYTPSPSSRAANAAKGQAAGAAASEQLRWDQAWHAVTSRIQLPSSVAVEDSFGTLAPESQDSHLDSAFYEALPLVLHPGAALPLAARTDDIFSWHGLQVRQHFLHHVLPLLAACTGQRGDSEILLGIVETLEAAHRQYFYGLHLLARGLHDDGSAADAAAAKFQRDLHALVSNSWTPSLMQALRGVLQRTLRLILASPSPGAKGFVPGAFEGTDAHKSRNDLFRLLDSLQKVGLAGEKFQVLFAEVMDACMQDFIKDTYSGVWLRPKTRESFRPGTAPMCMDHLRNWVETCYGRLAMEVISRLGGQMAWSDVERWREIAIGRLATLRMHELFDIVLRWPQSLGGLDDLGFAVTTPQRRLQLTDIFSATLQKRLLHPGRSTLDILQTYISMIRTFHALDHSKVLLDRVVPALKLCLWMRDDAIRIVVTGLLANHSAADPDDNKGKLVELAVILNEASQQQRRHADDEDLDWNDMSWVPDPVDAGVNYKRPKNEDIIGTLISALGLQDVFIKEFQAIVAERLLSKQPGFQQEIKVLGLLKKRFGDAALQNCDVMTKDIMESKGVDSTLLKNIHRDGDLDPDAPSYHAKILSRLFWPNLSSEPFAIPGPVAKVQQKYEAGFERLKSSRKLSWLDQLGSATVKLDLEDRSIEVECKTYEAAVIYAFGDDGSAEDDAAAAGPRRRDFNDLWMALKIDEDLLESALRFWTSKRVLREIGDQTYVVLERLDEDKEKASTERDRGAQQQQQQQQPSPKKNKVDSKEKDRRTIYWQFIVGMLTNSSPAMPLAQIAMMMKMLIADGCPWSNAELQEFLGEKVAEGELELVGGKYRLPKK